MRNDTLWGGETAPSPARPWGASDNDAAPVPFDNGGPREERRFEKSGAAAERSGSEKARLEEVREEYRPAAREDILSAEAVLPRRPEEARGENPLFSAPEEREDIPVIPLGQIADCFIVCQHGKDLFLIDQHAAHERIRYDRFAARSEGIPVQEILIPWLIHADPSDVDLLLEREDDLRRLGIVLNRPARM